MEEIVKAENTVAVLTEDKDGVFVTTLLRDNKSIKKDRAQAIIQDTQIIYKRKVEDLEIAISQMRRKQQAMLDLSPDNSLSLMPSLKNYEPATFVAEDVKLGYELRNLEIQYEVAVKRYEFLFGTFKLV